MTGNTDPVGSDTVERMLTRALAPVEPPTHLYDRLESKLEKASLAAAEELSDWELASMRDPRNWVKPATAAVVGGAAAGALVVMHLRSKRRDGDRASEAVNALRGAFGDVRREVERSARRRK
ncbi:MAG TPA: hypothetical protein VGO97_05700 [Solirubrobacterales bacterium]|jgi:hypothetical protein|nr:hypothetical protein [Solirubrobacterales bacterium]